LTIETSNTGGLEVTTPYFPRTKPIISEKLNSRAAKNTEAGPSNPNPIRAQLAAFGSRQNQVHEVDDDDENDDIQEVETRAIPRGNGKRKEFHAVENEDDDEIQEVDPPPKMTRSRRGSQKPPSTVNGKPTNNGVAKGKAKAKPKLGPTKPAAKPAQEPMDVDLNDEVEHDMGTGVNGTAAIANNINAAIKHNAGRAPKIQSGQQNEDGRIARFEEELRQVRFICKTLFVVLIV
jgi:hypothetical protein